MLNSDFDYARECRIDRVTADGLVTPGPAMVYSVVISNAAGGASLAKLYDGESTAGDQKCDFDMLASTTFQYRFSPPILFQRGVYVVVGTNTTSVMVQWSGVRL